MEAKDESRDQSGEQSSHSQSTDKDTTHHKSLEMKTLVASSNPEAHSTIQPDCSQHSETGSSGSQPISPANQTSDISSAHAESFNFKLAFVFRLCVYSPMKLKDGKCKLSIFHLLWLCIHALKLGFLTSLTFKIGQCREKLAFSVTDGYITLQHALLKDWDASFETLPYPPPHGQFASYTVDDLRNRIDYTVSQIYNIGAEANGHFRKLRSEKVTVSIGFYDFMEDDNGTVTKLDVRGWSTFEPSLGLTNFTNEDNITVYDYDLSKDLDRLNLSDVLHRMLILEVKVVLYSVRVDWNTKNSRCLRINVNVSFNNVDNNGQVIIQLTTLTFPVKCDFSTKENKLCSLENEEAACRTAEGLTFATAVGDSIMFFTGFSIVAIFYFSKDYKISESLANIQWWNVSCIVGDCFTLSATTWIGKMLKGQLESEDVLLKNWDDNIVRLGLGCLLTWFSFVRFIRIHNKFTLLVKTIRKAAVNIIFFLTCVILIFIGFWSCAYIVLGPYHIKFQKKTTAAETLFSMMNGDEIFATLAILQDEYAGDKPAVHLFLRVVIYAFVSLFTILIFNLLIALFNSAYEVVQEQNRRTDNTQSARSQERGTTENMRATHIESMTLREVLEGTEDQIESCKWHRLFRICFPVKSISD